MQTAPVLIVCLSDPGTYLDRYAAPDKGWTDRDPARWPVPYWDVDTGMAALLMLLSAVDQGLGGLFFGVPPECHAAVRSALGIPADRRLVGVVSIGSVSYTHLDVYKRQMISRAVARSMPSGTSGTPLSRARHAAYCVAAATARTASSGSV